MAPKKLKIHPLVQALVQEDDPTSWGLLCCNVNKKGSSLKISSRHEEILNELIKPGKWKYRIQGIETISYYYLDKRIGWEYAPEVIRKKHNNMAASTTPINDPFVHLSKTGRHFSIVSMITDTPFHATTSKLPYEGISFKQWFQQNHQGHYSDELIRYKNALDNAAPGKLSILQLNLDRPHLKEFQYKAKSLATGKSILCTVNAWMAEFEGEPVRVINHVNPPIYV